jgi:uncharacterized protein
VGLPLTNRNDARIEAVDSLRGFALAGIVIAHMLEQFIAAPRPQAAWTVESTSIDHAVAGLNILLVQGKFFAIFSVLFGASFAIMMERARERGQGFSGRFLWRLTVLMAIGFLHSLVYRGDILTVYAVIGFGLPLLWRLSPRALWIIVALSFSGAGRYLFLLITGTSTLLGYEMSPDAPQIITYVELLKNGSLAEIVRENFVNGFASKFDFQFGVFGRGYLTIGYFVVGMWLARSGVLWNLPRYRPELKRILRWSLSLAPACMLFAGVGFSMAPTPPDFATWIPNLAYGFVDLFNVCLTAALISGFLLLSLRRPGGAFEGLAAYGRTALSSYILQSLIGVVIFHGWGLGMLGKLSDWQTLVLALVIIFVQIQLSRAWLAHFKYGPLEWLWRCATYFRWMEFRANQPQLTERV